MKNSEEKFEKIKKEYDELPDNLEVEFKGEIYNIPVLNSQKVWILAKKWFLTKKRIETILLMS